MIREPKKKSIIIEKQSAATDVNDKNTQLPPAEDIQISVTSSSKALNAMDEEISANISEAPRMEADLEAEAKPVVTTLIDDTVRKPKNKRPQLTKEERRERKRNKTYSRVARRMSIAFFAMLFVMALLLLVIPRSTKSEVERRMLTSWPEFSLADYFSGDYTAGITAYYDDTVPMRDTFTGLGNNLKSLFGIKTKDTVEIIGNVSLVNQNTEEETSISDTSDIETASAADEEETSSAKENIKNSKDYHLENADASMEDGILVVYQDDHWRALILYGGVFDSAYSDTLNYVRQTVDEDVNIYFMPVPLSAQFYLPANYEDYSADQEAVFKQASAQMAEGITSIDIIGTLNDHNAEPIYLRTDHHWAQLGAYYAAKAFAEAAGVPFAELNTYTKYVNEGYVGTMYAYTSSSNILNDPEDFVYYVPTNAYTVDYYDSYFDYNFTYGLFYDTSVDNSYSMYMGGDTQIVKVTTDVKNGRRLLVVKDSYGNAEIPYFTGSFEEIYVIDQRYFDVNLISFIQYNAITDVLFTHNYLSLAGPETELLEYITYNNYENPVYDNAPEAVLPEK